MQCCKCRLSSNAGGSNQSGVHSQTWFVHSILKSTLLLPNPQTIYSNWWSIMQQHTRKGPSRMTHGAWMRGDSWRLPAPHSQPCWAGYTMKRFCERRKLCSSSLPANCHTCIHHSGHPRLPLLALAAPPTNEISECVLSAAFDNPHSVPTHCPHVCDACRDDN